LAVGLLLGFVVFLRHLGTATKYRPKQ
jgi:hypothetical protein